MQRMVVITTSQEAARAFTDMDNGLILVTSAKVVSLILMKGALVGPPNEFPMCLTLLQHILLYRINGLIFEKSAYSPTMTTNSQITRDSTDTVVIIFLLLTG